MNLNTFYKSLPKLVTNQLILRKIDKNDIEDIFHYGSNPCVSQKVGWDTHQSIEDTKEFVEFILDGYREHKKALWGMELKSTGKLVGTIDFVTLNLKHGNAEIGYVLSKDHWGHGLTTEATKKIIDFGFRDLQLERIQARCFIENIASQRVMEKVGMSFEGIVRKGMFAKGEFQDLKLYSILAEEFKQQEDFN
ncbi:GNAT family N-acetyltransferase [Halobacillus amylolyticus]|uniref:GNAT family N-acetyltransferase n=1 Tax=Halobacillus amylolyticus TaxID=2932259 RepID=A0ABY4HEP4_9BACI|nr:GNAT family protein [Halobacillus amylolyticus]UOR13266.1 GNAT family N-acetyltransferase [Halobacillus amylolyticus]